MSQIHFDKSRTQSDGSSVNEEYVISQFLNGDTDYKLSVAIRYATSGITTAVPSYLGQSFNNTTSDASVALSRGEPLTTQVEVSNVRYKQHGLDIDFNFRASELSFRWPNFGALGSVYKRRTLRFYLQVTLVPTSALSGKDPIYLLRTGWYKIKNVEKIYNTGSPSGIDAQIEAVPWVYEFNEKMKMCLTTPRSENNLNSDSTWTAFMSAPARLFYYQKIMHDRRRIKSINYPAGTAVYEEDAPSGYRGVFFRESDASPENLIDDLPAIQCPSCEETALTFFARLLTFKGAIKPDAYGNPVDEEQTIVDHPVLAWRDLTYLSRYGQYLSEWWSGGTYGLDNFDSVLDSNSVLITDCARKYIFKMYSYSVEDMGHEVFKNCHYEFTSDQGIFGFVEVSLEQLLGQLNKIESDYYEQVSIDDPDTFDDIMFARFFYSVSMDSSFPIPPAYFYYDNNGQVGTVDFVEFTTLSINKDSFTYYQLLWENSEIASNGFQGINLCFRPVIITKTDLEIVSDDAVEFTEVELDFNGLGYSTYSFTYNSAVNSRGKLLYTLPDDSVVYKYSQFLRKIEFSAEWRPWITIYDVVRVTYKDDSGVDATSFVFIQDIDANADTMSATYTGYILED